MKTNKMNINIKLEAVIRQIGGSTVLLLPPILKQDDRFKLGTKFVMIDITDQTICFKKIV